MAQLVERPTSAQVMISQLVSSGHTSGSVLTAQSLELALDSLSLPFLCSHSVCLSAILSLSRIKNIKKNFRGTWVAQSVERPTSAQVMISWSVSSRDRKSVV